MCMGIIKYYKLCYLRAHLFHIISFEMLRARVLVVVNGGLFFKNFSFNHGFLNFFYQRFKGKTWFFKILCTLYSSKTFLAAANYESDDGRIVDVFERCLIYIFLFFKYFPFNHDFFELLISKVRHVFPNSLKILFV